MLIDVCTSLPVVCCVLLVVVFGVWCLLLVVCVMLVVCFLLFVVGGLSLFVVSCCLSCVVSCVLLVVRVLLFVLG